MSVENLRLTPEALRIFAGYAGVKLEPQQAKHLATLAQELFSRFARLDEVELGETEPEFGLPLRSS